MVLYKRNIYFLKRGSKIESDMRIHEKTNLNSNYLEEEDSSDQLTYPTVIENSKYHKQDFDKRLIKNYMYYFCYDI